MKKTKNNHNNSFDNVEKEDGKEFIWWNPTTGCSEVSEGCRNCYALEPSIQLQNEGDKKYKNGFIPTVHENALSEPYNYDDERMVFVSHYSDLFHPQIPIDFIKKVFKVMNDNLQHRFFIWTKHIERVAKIEKMITWSKNIRLGVTVECEKYLNRIDVLRNTSASIKYVSFEPLLGPIKNVDLTGITYIIIGGEKGDGDLCTLQPSWLEYLYEECMDQNVNYGLIGWGDSKEAEHYEEICPTPLIVCSNLNPES